MAQQAAEAKPPYVTFAAVAVEDRAATLTNGAYTTKDVDFAFITPAGSKDIIEREVKDWFENIEKQADEKRFPTSWVRAFKESYKAWKEGNELPIHGTPIKTWPVPSPAQRQNLLNLHVTTVEALAECNEDVIRRLGMGGRPLKQQASDWLAANSDSAGKLANEMTQLRSRLEALEAESETLRDQNRDLRAQVNLDKPEVEPAGAVAGGLLDASEPVAVRKPL